MLLQFRYDLSARELLRRCRRDLGFRYALGLEAGWLDPRTDSCVGHGRPDRDRTRATALCALLVTPARAGSWYTAPIVERVFKKTKNTHLDTSMEHVRHFERMLTHERVVLLKLWFHLSKQEQRKRLERLEAQAYREAVNDMFERTSTEIAPWTMVEAEDKRFARIKVLRTFVEALSTKR